MTPFVVSDRICSLPAERTGVGLETTWQRYVRHHVFLLAFSCGHAPRRLDLRHSLVVSDLFTTCFLRGVNLTKRCGGWASLQVEVTQATNHRNAETVTWLNVSCHTERFSNTRKLNFPFFCPLVIKLPLGLGWDLNMIIIWDLLCRNTDEMSNQFLH